MVRVKICGIRHLEEAKACIEAGADALGFHVDLEHSKCPIGAAAAREIISKLPPFVSSVLVTTATDTKELVRLTRATWVNTLQLQGEVEIDTVRAVKAIMPWGKIYVAVHVSNEESIIQAQKFEDAADAIILDSKISESGARGGTGKTHDWNISRKIVESISLPVILAGGLNPENVVEAIKVVRPYAVDVETGVSNADHTKNPEKLRAFIQKAKSA